MKVVIFGSNGQTGLKLVEQALEQGHEVTAYVRSITAFKLKHPNLKVVLGRLAETMPLIEAITGADACISALGARSLKEPSPNIVGGIDRIVTLMEYYGVKRFIYLSSLGAGDSRYYMPRLMRFWLGDVKLRVPLTDHNTNELRIANSNLQWTIVRSGELTDGPLSGIFQYGTEKTVVKRKASISRSNVASFLLQQLEGVEYVNKSVWVFE